MLYRKGQKGEEIGMATIGNIKSRFTDLTRDEQIQIVSDIRSRRLSHKPKHASSDGKVKRLTEAQMMLRDFLKDKTPEQIELALRQVKEDMNGKNRTA